MQIFQSIWDSFESSGFAVFTFNAVTLDVLRVKHSLFHLLSATKER